MRDIASKLSSLIWNVLLHKVEGIPQKKDYKEILFLLLNFKLKMLLVLLMLNSNEI